MEFDLPLVIITNVVPYGIVGMVAALRRRGHMQRWPATLLAAAAIYALAIALVPIGAVARAREGWWGYALIFVLLGTFTWISFLFWWVAWLAWTGRIGSQQALQTSPPAFFLYRRSGPAICATGALVSGFAPWIFPVTSLPGGDVWLILMVVVVGAIWILAAAVNVSERAPRFLLPRDLASQPVPAGEPFWVDVVFVVVTIALALGPAIAIQSYTHWSAWILRLVILPVIFAAGVVAYPISRLVARVVR